MAEQIVKIKGLEQLRDTLLALPAHLGEKIGIGALRAAGRVIRDEALARVPVLDEPTAHRTPGTVRKNIVVRRSKKDPYAVFVSVKPLSRGRVRKFKKATGQKSSNNPNDPYYWWYVEFGTEKTPAQPFLRPAFEQQKLLALAQFERNMSRRIVRESRKLARQKGLK